MCPDDRDKQTLINKDTDQLRDEITKEVEAVDQLLKTMIEEKQSQRKGILIRP
jgi:hypothetical protein